MVRFRVVLTVFRDRDCGVCSIAGILAHIRQAADPSAVRFTCICLAVPLHVLLPFDMDYLCYAG